MKTFFIIAALVFGFQSNAFELPEKLQKQKCEVKVSRSYFRPGICYQNEFMIGIASESPTGFNVYCKKFEVLCPKNEGKEDNEKDS